MMRAALLLGCCALAAPACPQTAAPPGSRKEIATTPIVLACVDRKGELKKLEIAESSGLPDIDAAALKVAQHTKYAPGKKPNGKPLRLSCIRFKVKFVLEDGEPRPAES